MGCQAERGRETVRKCPEFQRNLRAGYQRFANRQGPADFPAKGFAGGRAFHAFRQVTGARVMVLPMVGDDGIEPPTCPV